MIYYDPEKKAVVWEESIEREETDEEIADADKTLMQEMRIVWPT